jgi:hypothetical protein
MASAKCQAVEGQRLQACAQSPCLALPRAADALFGDMPVACRTVGFQVSSYMRAVTWRWVLAGLGSRTSCGGPESGAVGKRHSRTQLPKASSGTRASTGCKQAQGPSRPLEDTARVRLGLLPGRDRLTWTISTCCSQSSPFEVACLTQAARGPSGMPSGARRRLGGGAAAASHMVHRGWDRPGLGPAVGAVAVVEVKSVAACLEPSGDPTILTKCFGVSNARQAASGPARVLQDIVGTADSTVEGRTVFASAVRDMRQLSRRDVMGRVDTVVATSPASGRMDG